MELKPFNENHSDTDLEAISRTESFIPFFKVLIENPMTLF